MMINHCQLVVYGADYINTHKNMEGQKHSYWVYWLGKGRLLEEKLLTYKQEFARFVEVRKREK